MLINVVVKLNLIIIKNRNLYLSINKFLKKIFF